jgi:hypothetical protein
MTAYTETDQKSIRCTSKGKRINLFPKTPRNRVTASFGRLQRWVRVCPRPKARFIRCLACGEKFPSRHLPADGICPLHSLAETYPF